MDTLKERLGKLQDNLRLLGKFNDALVGDRQHVDKALKTHLGTQWHTDVETFAVGDYYRHGAKKLPREGAASSVLASSYTATRGSRSSARICREISTVNHLGQCLYAQGSDSDERLFLSKVLMSFEADSKFESLGSSAREIVDRGEIPEINPKFDLGTLLPNGSFEHLCRNFYTGPKDSKAVISPQHSRLLYGLIKENIGGMDIEDVIATITDVSRTINQVTSSVEDAARGNEKQIGDLMKTFMPGWETDVDKLGIHAKNHFTKQGLFLGPKHSGASQSEDGSVFQLAWVNGETGNLKMSNENARVFNLDRGYYGGEPPLIPEAIAIVKQYHEGVTNFVDSNLEKAHA
jgi:hypothetical protein